MLSFENHLRIFSENSKGTTFDKIYSKQEISIVADSLKQTDIKDKLNYFRALAAALGNDDETDNKSNYLKNQYSKLAALNEDSILSNYLGSGEVTRTDDEITAFFPFGINLSQRQATLNALSSSVSIIEGPPGTGKTQTILNIIANALINDKTVAVVSNNNSATANVYEKLEKSGLSFIAALLGNQENRKEFFENIEENYPDFSDWYMDSVEIDNLKHLLLSKNKALNEMLAAKNKLAEYIQLFNDLTLEKKHFDEFKNNKDGSKLSYNCFKKHDSNKAIELWYEFGIYARRNKKPGLFAKIKNLIKYGIYSFSFYQNSTNAIIRHFQNLFYEELEKELKEKIEVLENKLNDFNFDTALEEYVSSSMCLLKASLAQRFQEEKRPHFEYKSYKSPKNFKEFIQEYPVILSTTHALRDSAQENYLFDYLIIDEASQVGLVAGALSLSCARNAVIVGDLKQLSNIVEKEFEEPTNEVFKKYKVPQSYHYSKNSLLLSAINIFKNAPRTLLKEHYRCHPQIINYCNKKFYRGQLIIMTESKENDKALTIYRASHSVQGNMQLNFRQIEVIKDEVVEDLKLAQKDVGAIAPYRKQVDALKKHVDDIDENDTVHKFQGREKEIIVLTTVSNKINDFIDDPHLVNVAVSRAQKQLIVVVSGEIEKSQSNIGDLIRYTSYNNCDIVHSQIHSIFDLLYKNYSGYYFERMKNRKKISTYDSENLMNKLLEDILSLPEFSHLYYVFEYKLSEIFRDLENLEDDEKKFVNTTAHVDFLICNTLDKKPVLGIEVDGFAFHDEKPEQLKRDGLKNQIFEKFNIELMRCKTIESREEEKIKKRLSKILNSSVAESAAN